MGKTIIINKDYFSNIEKAIASINNFFSSDFKTKDFPDTSDGTELDGGICSCIDSFESVDPRWISNPEVADEAVDKLNSVKEELLSYSADRGEENFFAFCSDSNNNALADLGHEYLAFKSLQEISDNFSDFEKLLNGIYSFELFTTPSAYKSVIEKFSDNVPTSECEDVLGNEEAPIFDAKRYINGLFENDDIQFPDGFDVEDELTRFLQFKDLTDVDVNITENTTPVQEAAEVNHFTNTKPVHIKYTDKRFKISDQFTKTVDDIVSGLRKCNTTDDLKSFITSESDLISKLDSVVAPFILVQAYVKKTDKKTFSKYTDSYASIIKSNAGAKRFENYDIFTTFKADKEGTIKFIEDFLKLRLVNDAKSSISNNTILTLFNIFDSRIYYDIMYNMIPESEKKNDGMDEDSFVRTKRAGINKNSRNSNSYAAKEAEETPSNIKPTSSEIKEYALNMMKSMGDMSISDMMHCESWHDILEAEINTLDDSLYNAKIPVSETNKYIGESFDVVAQLRGEMIMESDDIRKSVNRNTVAAMIVGAGAATGATALVTGGSFALISPIAGAVGSGIVVKKYMKMLRGKGIKSEITRDITNVMKLFDKETDVIDSYIIKDLKKRCKTLAESLDFAIKRKKTFNDDERELLIDLHHSTKRIIAVTTKTDVRPEDLKSVVEIFIKNADKVLKMLLNTNDAEVNAEIKVNSNESTEEEIESAKKAADGIEEGDDDDDTESDDDIDDNVVEDDESDTDDSDDDNEEDEPKNVQEALITTARNARKQVIKGVSVIVPDMESIIRANERGSLTRSMLERMYGGYDYYISSGSAAYGDYYGTGVGTTTKQHSDSPEMNRLLKVMKIDNKIFKKSAKKDRWKNKFSDAEFEILHELHEVLGNFTSDVRDCVNAKTEAEGNKMLKFVTNDAKELIQTINKVKQFESVSPVAEYFSNMPDRFAVIQETDTGKIPAYMQTRIALSDASGKKKPTIEDTAAPSDDGNVPSNNIDDMAESIDEKVNAATDMNDLLGKEAKKEGSHIVYNVTNNYNYSNSFNKTTSNDLSTGKTTSSDSSVHSHSQKTDLSTNDNSVKSSKDESVKSIKNNDTPSNNKYNSTDSSNTKDAKNVQEFSTGYTVEDVFAFLESEEPLLEATGVTKRKKPPKEDSLTKAMDADRKSLSSQQAAKKTADDVVATTKAVTKPVVRTKHWLLGIVDSLVKRREDKVKADLIQSPSYRTAVFRAGRIALKAGLLGVFTTINLYLGIAYAALLASNAYDKQRLRKEVEAEFATEMKILDNKIELASQENTPESRKAMWEMMRLRGKMERIVTNDAMRTRVVHPTSAQ